MKTNQNLLATTLICLAILAAIIAYAQWTAPRQSPLPCCPAEAIQVVSERGLKLRDFKHPHHAKSQRIYLTTSQESPVELLKTFWPEPTRQKGTVSCEPMGVYAEPLEKNYLQRGNLLFRGDPELLEQIRKLLD
jgi:hypothetical protein